MLRHLAISALMTSIALGLWAKCAHANLEVRDLGNNQAEADFNPINFVATGSPDQGIFIVVEDFFANDSTEIGIAESGRFEVSINSQPIQTFDLLGGAGQFVTPFEILDPNDLIFDIFDDTLDFAPGDTVQIAGIDLVYSSNLINTPSSASSFEVTIADFDGNAITNTVLVNNANAIPEPSSLAILGIGLLALTGRRRCGGIRA